MSKSKQNPRFGLNALRHGPNHSTGAMTNPRHPKKFKLAPMDKKTAPGDSPAWAAETVYQFPR